MAMHTQNLQADPRASLLVTRDDTDGDPLGASRVRCRKCSADTAVGGGRGLASSTWHVNAKQQVLGRF